MKLFEILNETGDESLAAKKARLAKLKADLKEFPSHPTTQAEADAVDELHDKIADLEKYIRNYEKHPVAEAVQPQRQIDVELHFDDQTGDPTYYASEDGRLIWNYGDVEGADWKDKRGQQQALATLSRKHPGTEIVILFDGSDAVFYASMADAQRSNFPQSALRH